MAGEPGAGDKSPRRISRRDFLIGAGAVAAAGAFVSHGGVGAAYKALTSDRRRVTNPDILVGSPSETKRDPKSNSDEHKGGGKAEVKMGGDHLTTEERKRIKSSLSLLQVKVLRIDNNTERGHRDVEDWLNAGKRYEEGRLVPGVEIPGTIIAADKITGKEFSFEVEGLKYKHDQTEPGQEVMEYIAIRGILPGAKKDNKGGPAWGSIEDLKSYERLFPESLKGRFLWRETKEERFFDGGRKEVGILTSEPISINQSNYDASLVVSMDTDGHFSYKVSFK